LTSMKVGEKPWGKIGFEVLGKFFDLRNVAETRLQRWKKDPRKGKISPTSLLPYDKKRGFEAGPRMNLQRAKSRVKTRSQKGR